MYLLYDNKAGPEISEEQPDEGRLRCIGRVKVVRGGLKKEFELFAESDSKRTWARLLDWAPCIDGSLLTEHCSIGG